jgi:glycolate oxidase FAD binding subunit
MSDTLKPRDQKDVEAAVAWALAEGKTLELLGHGSKRALGRAAQWDLSLDLSGLSGVTLYEPDELVLSAKAGTPMREIEALLAKSNQELAFEPPDYGPLLGAAPGRGTIGGILATNLSGPRRLKAGAARDHFLGVTTLSGRAETFKSGGRVVKNVTGYDMCKVLAGSYGTLGAMTDVTVKVLPRAETEQTVLVLGLDDAKAAQAMSLAMGSANDVSGAAHLPAAIAARVAQSHKAVTALRLEGVAPSVTHRRRALEVLLKPFGEMAALDETSSRALWTSLRDVMPFTGDNRAVWRISVAPTRGPDVANAIGEGAEFFYDWAGGLIWAALPSATDGGAAAVRRALGGHGHATLIRAPAAVRAAVPVFEPQDAGLAALTRRVKESFDPKGIFGPGRMYAGI